MIKHIRPESLEEKYKTFAPRLAVTKGEFEIDVPNLLEDMEWNHMDQLHRPFIHHTYEESVRIALGEDFAISLTRWKRIPLFITVSDIRVKPGLYYQIMTIAGLLLVHLIITMEEKNEIVHLKIEWIITSSKWLRFLHKPLSKKFYKLNTRLQEEDSQIRSQRYRLRKKGYTFASDPVDYYRSNVLERNTIYPDLPVNAFINVEQITEELKSYPLGDVDFLVQKKENIYLIWPAACPHEGGELAKGKTCKNNQIQCPWHGLRFSAIQLSASMSEAQGYGFYFKLDGGKVSVVKLEQLSPRACRGVGTLDTTPQ